MAEFVKGQRVHGQLYAYPNGTATGVYLSTDQDGDVEIRVEQSSVDWADPGGRHCLRRGTVVPAIEYDQGPLSARAKTLRKAESLITGDRNRTYGDPTDNFRDIAEVWTTYLKHKLRDGETISSGDTAWMMIGLKMVRAKAQPSMDNWVDAAGYAGCGSEADLAEGVIE